MAVQNRVTGDPLLSRFAEIDSATLHEAGGRIGAVDYRIKPIYPGASVAGRAFTARCHPGDNLAIHRAVAAAEPGDVLVVDAGGDVGGYWGEVLASSAQGRGVRALVIDGGVRDVAAQQRRGFPCWSRGVSIRGCVKVTPGSIGEPITCGGVYVRTGDYVVADDDGVVVIPRERAEEVLVAAEQRIQKEAKLMQQLEAGEVTLDLLGLREILRQSGID
jgi:4-hydroxy-4-methyl-2-oxoglutarate aldolase